MRQFIFSIAILAILIPDSYGQNKTYLGFEAALANDIYKITSDNGGYLKSIPLHSGTWGFHIRQEVETQLFLESGFMIKFYQEGVGFTPILYNGSSSGDPSWLIPFRLGYKINVSKNNIHIAPILGYVFGINPPFGYGASYGTYSSGTTTINFQILESPNVSRYFSLIQTGLALEFKLFNSIIFSLYGNYFSGFNQITILNVDYTVNSSSDYTGTAESKGQFWDIGGAIKYPISNFWNKKY